MHNKIKTYSLNGEENILLDFNLKKMEDIHDKYNGKPDRAHRHDYFTIILVNKSAGKHFIDFKEYALSDKSLHFIYPGQVHQIITTSKPHGWVLNFSKMFLVKNGISNQIINDVYLYNEYGESEPLSINQKELDAYEEIIVQMKNYSIKDSVYKYDALGSLLKLFLIQSNNLCTLSKEKDVQSIEVGNHLVRKFKQFIETDFRESHKVSSYADKLAVTSDYLNKSVKSLTGKSAKEHILNRIIVEAKRELLFTDQSNKELSFYLGFDEPSHFSNFFKKYSGVTPNNFRSASRQI